MAVHQLFWFQRGRQPSMSFKITRCYNNVKDCHVLTVFQVLGSNFNGDRRTKRVKNSPSMVSVWSGCGGMMASPSLHSFDMGCWVSIEAISFTPIPWKITFIMLTNYTKEVNIGSSRTTKLQNVYQKDMYNEIGE